MTADQASRMRAMARWHRRIAVLVMVWLAALAATGIVVNHANDWGLDRAPLADPLQRWVYGIETGGEDFCSGSGVEGLDCARVFARFEWPDSILLLATHSLFLLDADGRLLEKLAVGQAGLSRLTAAYLDVDRLYLGDGDHIVRTGPGLLGFEGISADEANALADVDWRVPPSQATAITWERLLLDLHAARFLGPFAKAFNDIVAGLILLLALSGLWLHRIKAKASGRNS